MAKTLPDLVLEVRDLLQDTRASSYRVSDARLVGLINTAFREVYRLRPDAFIGCCSDDGIEIPTYTTADLVVVPAIAFPIDELFYQAVVFHVMSVAELSEDEFVLEGRAVTVMAGFRQMLLGG